MYNLLIGGAAGQGIDTAAAILEKLLKRSGYSVFTMRDFMSRIRGGHNFSQIRFGAEQVLSHGDRLDGIIALNEETIGLHRGRLNPDGFILCDGSVETDDPLAIKIGMDAMAKAAGNPKAAGSVAVGAVLKLFGESLSESGGRIQGVRARAVSRGQPQGRGSGLCGHRKPISPYRWQLSGIT